MTGAAQSLFQELMCTKQSENKTPQQFLYHIMGLKQKILFAARQADADKNIMQILCKAYFYIQFTRA